VYLVVCRVVLCGLVDSGGGSLAMLLALPWRQGSYPGPLSLLYILVGQRKGVSQQTTVFSWLN
jgi:hypothetical protein